MVDEVDLTKIENELARQNKELALMNDLKIFELGLILYLSKENNELDKKTYDHYLMKLKGFRK